MNTDNTALKLSLVASDAPRTPPDELSLGMTILHLEAKLDSRCPLAMYEYVDRSGEAWKVYAVLLLGSTDDEDADDTIACAKHAMREAYGPGVVTVVQTPSTSDAQRAIVFNADTRSIPLQDWSVQRKRSTRDTLRMFAAIADCLDRLHGVGIVELCLHPSTILVDPKGQPSVFPIGRVATNPPKGPMPPETHSRYERSMRDDLQCAGSIIMETMGIDQPSDCKHPEFRMILRRLHGELPTIPYTLASDLSADLRSAANRSTIAWVHTTVASRVRNAVRAHAIAFGVVASLLLAIASLAVVTSYQSMQMRSDASRRELQIMGMYAPLSKGVTEKIVQGDSAGAMHIVLYLSQRIPNMDPRLGDGFKREFSTLCFDLRMRIHDSGQLDEREDRALLSLMLRDARRDGLVDLVGENAVIFAGIEPAPDDYLAEPVFLNAAGHETKQMD